MIRRVLKCLLLHRRRHSRFERAIKCRKCGLYLRNGSASRRWFKAP